MDVRYKTFRHIETVRNYLNVIVRELLERGEAHDQSKFEEPEVSAYEKVHDRLKDVLYGSEEYFQILKEIEPAILHHKIRNSSHHPDSRPNGIRDMNLFDLVEMMADWKAATFRQTGGDLKRSVEINQKRFGYSDEFKQILLNTAAWLDEVDVCHCGHEQ